MPAVVILGLAAGSLWSGQFLYPLWFIGMKIAAVCVLLPFLLLLEMGRLARTRAEDPKVPIRPEHKMTVAQVKAELEPEGFRLEKVSDALPRQHILIFRKTATP